MGGITLGYDSFSVLTRYGSCFPHVINLAVQVVYAALKDRKILEKRGLLQNPDSTDEALKATVFPGGITGDAYLRALKADVLGVT